MEDLNTVWGAIATMAGAIAAILWTGYAKFTAKQKLIFAAFVVASILVLIAVL
jgi:hypothetical protein